MSISTARLLATAITTYGLLGILFAAFFVARGVDRFDPAARGTSWFFRLLIFPGAAALWPYLAWRWRRATRPPQQGSAP